MKPVLSTRAVFTRWNYTTDLMLNSPLRYWRSRQGFMLMLSLLRLACIVAIMFRFVVLEEPAGFFAAWFTLPYTLISLLILFAVLYVSDYSRLDHALFYAAVILCDVVAIIGYLFRSLDYTSELYLLLLLPLILTSHYHSRGRSVIISGLVVATYFFTLVLMKKVQSVQEILSIGFYWHWLSRSIFLLWATWVYRMQANFPRVNEKRIVSPEKARNRLDELLVDFLHAVHYDTISVQILYRGRLQIVACRGFSNPQEICQIEFPANDARYPNYAVLKYRKWQILNPLMFPSFREPRYHASHIRTWLGVPLISPSTGECFGLLSVDSASPESYNRWDAIKASWFALRVSSFLTEVSLGPAALTQATKRENLLKMLKDWSECFQAKRISKWEDDQQAAAELVRLGGDIFHVEDCSIYFLKHKVDEVGEKVRVLHLVASSAIPREIFALHEIKVTGHHGDGLTGLAVHRNRTINYGAEQIKRSPYRTNFVKHLRYLFSKRSRQIMIVPLRDSRGKTTGAIKLENRLGWPSEKPFFPVEEHSFEIFAAMTGLVLEDIRLRNFADRQAQNIHNLRSIVYNCALRPLDQMLDSAAQDGRFGDMDLETLGSIQRTVSYTNITMDSLLADDGEDLTLEREGLIPAIQEYVKKLNDMRQFSLAVQRVTFFGQDLRENLPRRVRVGFYNVAREALLNMARHSGIEREEDGYGTVSFFAEENTYHLLVEDNGIGFLPQEKINQPNSYGLRHMTNQKESISKHCQAADVHIISSLGTGAKIHVWATLE